MSEDPTMGGKVSPLLEEGEIKSEEDAVCPGSVCNRSEKEGAGIEQSDDDEDVDSEAEEKLPICAQANLTRLRQQVKKLRAEKRRLKEDLAKKDKKLTALIEINHAESISNGPTEGDLARMWGCAGCSNLQSKVEALKGKLAQARLELGKTQAAGSTEEEKVDPVKVEKELSLAEQVRQAAEAAVVEQGMIYEPTSGLYYHQASGYYFDAERSLYYDGNSGTWYRWDADKGEYVVYSTAPQEEVAAHQELQRRKEEQSQEKKKIRQAKREKKRKERQGEETNNDEEGSDSEDLESEDEEEDSIPPCVRMIVLDSGDPKVRPGSLHLVTIQGGSIGSYGNHEVLIPDTMVSRRHATLSFRNGKYFLKDLGSSNGTLVNEARVAQDDEMEVGHGTVVQVGQTRLSCHLHPGTETCLQCEPGVVGQPSAQEVEQEEERKRREMEEVLGKQKSRRAKMRSLKRKYGLERAGAGVSEGEIVGSYEDRAADRRRVKGSSHPGEKTQVASVDVALGTSNKGHAMLAKMGWKGGGLGKKGGGRDEPVLVEQRADRAGLGAEVVHPAPQTGLEKKKSELWSKTQKRFASTALLEDPNKEDEDDQLMPPPMLPLSQ